MPHPLQNRLPYDVTAPRPLPGIAPFDMGDWLQRDDAFAGQMARRDDLIATRRDAVIALDPGAQPAAAELLDLVLSLAYGDAGASGPVTRADGAQVAIRRDDPMATLGHLVQEDFCILQKPDGADEHVMTGAVLCFPAFWSLSEKFMRPLSRIHDPVPDYDDQIARRVQRLFDGVQVGRPLWRFNLLRYGDPELHQPAPLSGPARREPAPGARAYLRSERQCLVRLPVSRAVVFSIHTYVVADPGLPG
ncbi:MAG: DUF3445 domain-containing protein [Marinibacterium sp.]|nr:DUF3445 domain-containing protein [Marinibacterium sp.]